MAKDKKYQDAFSIFTDKSVSSIQPVTVDTGLDPRTFSQTDPIERPDVPTIE